MEFFYPDQLRLGDHLAVRTRINSDDRSLPSSSTDALRRLVSQSRHLALITWDVAIPLQLVEATGTTQLGMPVDVIECDSRLFWEFVEESDRPLLQSHLSAFYQPDETRRETTGEIGYSINNGDRTLMIREETFATYDNGELSSLQSLLTADRSCELEEQNQFFRKILNLVPSWIFIKNSRHEYQFVNESYASIYGVTPGECLGKTAIDLGADPECAIGNPEKGIEGFWAADHEVLATGKSVEIEAEPIFIDGQTRFLQTLKIPVADDQLFGFVHDVSTLKEMESRFAIELRDNKAINLVNVALRADNEVGATLREVGRIVLESLEADRAIIEFRGGEPILVHSRDAVSDDEFTTSMVESIEKVIEFASRQIGVLKVDRMAGRDAFESVDANLAQQIANQIAFKLHQRELAEEISFRAFHDSLTNLPNRESLIAKLRQATQDPDSQISAVIFLDLDGFKTVNDTLGHHAGDEILLAVSSRLGEITDKENWLARLGGDEFGIVLPNLSDRESGMEVVRTYLESFTDSFNVMGREIHLGASIGITFFPQDGRDVATLLRNADAAMYAAKASGKNSFRVFTEEITKKSNERLLLEADLRRSIALEELRLVYQPKIDLETLQCVGVEALTRWMHPVRGRIGPDRFIPVAEDSGFIIELGHWAIREACSAAVRWHRENGVWLTVAVNVSPIQVERPDFVEMVLRTVAESGMPTSNLEVEVTETQFMRHISGFAPKLQALRDQGITVSIDDFGTGYSCLSALQDLPIDCLKIDKCFLDCLEGSLADFEGNHGVLGSIVYMANAMELRTVAEGIETAKQLDIARLLGVDIGQGYFFAKPMEESAVLAACRQRGVNPAVSDL